MLVSRALNRGYAESRFAWPVAFGLLNNDCRWVFDEVQLMGPALTTSAQLDGLRRRLGTTIPCESLWMSATAHPEALCTVDRPAPPAVVALPQEDRTGQLARRLNAVKRLERLDLTQIAAKKIPSALAEAVAERHAVGTRTLVVVNTVARAQGVTRALQRLLARAEPRPTVALVHSRFRPPERREAMDAAMAEPDPLAGTIVVATQVVEAGIDLSSRLLITEPAPFSSIVQRLGRCNRAGEHDEGTVAWLDTGPLPGGTRPAVKAAAPYRPADLEAARQALLAREGESLSPSAVEGLEVPETAADPAVLRRRDLLDLFDTSPDYVGWWEDPRMRPPTPTRWSGSC